MAKGRTKKQQEEMEALSKHNNSQRYFWTDGKWYEMTGTHIFLNGGVRHDIKPDYKGQNYITDKEYKEIISKFRNENKHLIF